MKRFDKAVRYNEEALTIFQKSHGPGNRGILVCINTNDNSRDGLSSACKINLDNSRAGLANPMDKRICGMVSDQRICGKCEKIETKLQSCGNCSRIHYCSVECMNADWDRHAPQCAMWFGCGGCETKTKPLYPCSGCKCLRYCSSECKNQHWGRHKAYCLKWKDINARSFCTPLIKWPPIFYPFCNIKKKSKNRKKLFSILPSQVLKRGVGHSTCRASWFEHVVRCWIWPATCRAVHQCQAKCESSESSTQSARAHPNVFHNTDSAYAQGTTCRLDFATTTSCDQYFRDLLVVLERSHPKMCGQTDLTWPTWAALLDATADPRRKQCPRASCMLVKKGGLRGREERSDCPSRTLTKLSRVFENKCVSMLQKLAQVGLCVKKPLTVDKLGECQHGYFRAHPHSLERTEFFFIGPVARHKKRKELV